MIYPLLVNLPEGGRFGSAISRVFSSKTYHELYHEVRNLDWQEAQQHFYRQRERNLAKVPIFQEILSDRVRRQIADAAGAYFGEAVEKEFDVAAHKMIEGDYISCHTDENDLGEAFRMTVTLNEGWRKEHGGIFLTLRSSKLTDVDGAWLPSGNNGMIFRISERSYHAVTPVTSKNPRYSLIFTFKRADGRSLPDLWKRWYPFPLKSDLEEARHTAGRMGVAGETFDREYFPHAFDDAQGLLDFVGGELGNAPRGLTYETPGSCNVDEFGDQPRGTDRHRIEEISRIDRLPPICLVRRKSSGWLLANGSHRLSHAVSTGIPIHTVIFDEVF